MTPAIAGVLILNIVQSTATKVVLSCKWLYKWGKDKQRYTKVVQHGGCAIAYVVNKSERQKVKKICCYFCKVKYI